MTRGRAPAPPPFPAAADENSDQQHPVDAHGQRMRRRPEIEGERDGGPTEGPRAWRLAPIIGIAKTRPPTISDAVRRRLPNRAGEPACRRAEQAADAALLDAAQRFRPGRV